MTVKGATRRQYSEEEIARVMALYRQTGRKPYRTANLSGVPRMTIVQWVQRYGEGFGAAASDIDVADVPVSVVIDGANPVEDATPSETKESVLGTLMKLSQVRHRYLDRLLRPEVVAKTTAASASTIVKDATAQIQLLTGQPTGRSETRVRYVDRGALRELARRTKQNRVIEVTKTTDS